MLSAPGAAIMTLAGLEHAVPGSVGRCLFHWATGPDEHKPVTEQDATGACPQHPTALARISGMPEVARGHSCVDVGVSR